MNSKVRQLPPSVVEFSEEEPEKESMQIKFVTRDKSQALVTLPYSVDLPDGHNMSITLGRNEGKISYWKSNNSFLIDKLKTHLIESDGEIHPASSAEESEPRGFLSRNRSKVALRNRLAVSYLGKTYATALQAQKMGGKRGVGEKKTINLLPRVLCALTLHKITSGVVNLILAIPFEGNQDWEAQEALAIQSVEGRRSWVSSDGTRHEVAINCCVFPESYHAELLPRLPGFEDYPDWSGENHQVNDLGHQTFIKTIYLHDPVTGACEFDPDLSECHDGYGMSRFYGYVATACGYEDPEDQDFIEAVNNKKRVFETAEKGYELSNAISTSADKFLNELVAIGGPKRGFFKVQMIGGGAYDFGDALCSHYKRIEYFIPELPELADVIGMSLSLPEMNW